MKGVLCNKGKNIFDRKVTEAQSSLIKIRILRRRVLVVFFLFGCGCAALGVILSGCTHGLEPFKVQPGFGGTIRFVLPWPPHDSVRDIRVVAFYDYPPKNIIGEVLSGQAKVYPPIGSTPLPTFVDSLQYTFDTDPATFQYLVVALQYGPNVFSDWKVVGAYGYSHGVGSPKPVIIPEDSYVNGIDIEVDFQNTPPTPNDTLAVLTSK
ncbi:MAG: hypothetical protein M1470_07925 [Bacteroidetes bacterium]|nr:hypothetical protein [Bacteroidota bacterium]MCL5738499.1 hypothetical protein [Bacteroidota bacterium]